MCLGSVEGQKSAVVCCETFIIITLFLFFKTFGNTQLYLKCYGLLFLSYSNYPELLTV